MTAASAKAFLRSLLARIEVLRGRVSGGVSPIDVHLAGAVDATSSSALSPTEGEVTLFVKPGNYYSPIVDPQELRAAGFRMPSAHADLLGIDCDMNRMRITFDKLSRHGHDLKFPERKSAEFRYNFSNDMFSYGGALILAGIIREYKAKRIIEVGSGYSSAVILDTLDRTPELAETKCTFIDPYSGRINSLLRESDRGRIRIISQSVQSVPVSIFEELEANDVLFLDTTHIVKTGSDVVYELFEVLPRLASGVVIHFHDIFAGFEYQEPWIFEQNRSWNEIYALRAFLMYNSQFEILFWIEQFLLQNNELVREKCPMLAAHPDGGLWIRKL